MGLAAMGHVSAVGLAVNTAGGQLPAVGRTANDRDYVQDGLVAIVDDDEHARAGLRALIESWGYRSATFSSAEDYLAAEMIERTACLILDVHLLGMSGPALQAQLISSGRCPPIVFATGRFEEQVQKRVIAAGALGYFRKPCNQKALLDCIGRVLHATGDDQ